MLSVSLNKTFPSFLLLSLLLFLQTTVSDVLHAMGAVPSGFRMSTLSKCFNEGKSFETFCLIDRSYL